MMILSFLIYLLCPLGLINYANGRGDDWLLVALTGALAIAHTIKQAADREVKR